MSGSGLFSDQRGKKPHLSDPGKGGVLGEVGDLRADVGNVMAKLAAITVQEWIDPVALANDGLEAATATTVAPRTVTTFEAAGVAALAAYPRNVTFTTAGATPADAPANAVVTGTDIDGNALTETVTVPQTAATGAGVKAFKTVTSVAYAAADGTGATVAIGFGDVFGLEEMLIARGGGAAVVQEIEAGSAVTTGTFVLPASSPPYGTYAPATAADGSNDYAVYYEYDPTA
jgi:hypothetical protein